MNTLILSKDITLRINLEIIVPDEIQNELNDQIAQVKALVQSYSDKVNAQNSGNPIKRRSKQNGSFMNKLREMVSGEILEIPVTDEKNFKNASTYCSILRKEGFGFNVRTFKNADKAPIKKIVTLLAYQKPHESNEKLFS